MVDFKDSILYCHPDDEWKVRFCFPDNSIKVSGLITPGAAIAFLMPELTKIMINIKEMDTDNCPEIGAA